MSSRQKCPVSLKEGSVLYSAFFSVDDDTGSASGTIYEEVVRSIRRRRNSSPDSPQYATVVTRIDGLTWISKPPLSLKTAAQKRAFSPGWAAYVPKSCLTSFPVGGFLPRHLYTTALLAIRHAVSEHQDDVHWYENEIAGKGDGGLPEGENLEILLKEKKDAERCLKLAKSALTKERNKRATKTATK